MPKTLDGLNDWRRTHYSIEVKPDLDGSPVTVFGRVQSIRRQGGITFIILNDMKGIVQVTVHKENSERSLLEKVERLPQHSLIGVRGVVRSIVKAPHGAEILPSEIKILSEPRKDLPFDPYGRVEQSIDKRLDLRMVDLLRPQSNAIFKIRSVVLESIREYLYSRDFIEVNTPKIISSATEGGAALFPLLYYDKEAFLAQSPQLYKEQLAAVFEKVFEIGPIFRAEQFRTLKHLSEAVSVDVEEAYVNYVDVMELLEGMLKHVVDTVRKRCGGELATLNVKLEPVELPLKRVTYDEVLNILEGEGVKVEWGEDLSTPILKTYSKILSDYHFIIDWPTKSKAFYIKPRRDRPEVCESFDFMYGSVELASGGSRIDDRKELTERLKEKGLNPKNFEYHLKTFDYGIPPHAGFGLGLDRLIMVLVGAENIREVVLYPRDPQRLTP
ncbi:MAG: aspartate--tRNA(Asn) ligase [Candidatus Bathyarchaeia archaeon]|nr:aspartate--tRNA(Asn) ligase [Candidatus Bathyarchaeota archaeon]